MANEDSTLFGITSLITILALFMYSIGGAFLEAKKVNHLKSFLVSFDSRDRARNNAWSIWRLSGLFLRRQCNK